MCTSGDIGAMTGTLNDGPGLWRQRTVLPTELRGKDVQVSTHLNFVLHK